MNEIINAIPIFQSIPEEYRALGFFVLIVWSLLWKGLALWRAAEQRSRNWFIAILIVNTFGILEILYLFLFSKKKSEIV
jgi:hypothetical protein